MNKHTGKNGKSSRTISEAQSYIGQRAANLPLADDISFLARKREAFLGWWCRPLTHTLLLRAAGRRFCFFFSIAYKKLGSVRSRFVLRTTEEAASSHKAFSRFFPDLRSEEAACAVTCGRASCSADSVKLPPRQNKLGCGFFHFLIQVTCNSAAFLCLARNPQHQY